MKRLLTLLLCLGMVACQPEPQPAPPSLNDLPEGYGIDPPEPNEFHRPAAMQASVVMHVIQLPLDHSTDDAWAMTDGSTWAPDLLELMQANGMRVGRISPAQLNNVIAALPPSVGQITHRITTRGDLMEFLATPQLSSQANVPIVLEQADAHTPQIMSPVSSGQLKLIGQMGPHPQGGVSLLITPQHHLPRRTLEVLTPDERLRQGWLIEELQLSIHLPREHWLMIGLHRPWPRLLLATPEQWPTAWPVALSRTGVTAAPLFTTHYLAPPQPPFIDAPPPELPLSLGYALFARERENLSTQTVLLIAPSQ